MNNEPLMNNALKLLSSQIKHHVSMDLWMFTRVIENDWIIVAVTDNSYGVSAGDVLPWDESVCSRMVKNEGPNLVPNIELNDDYKKAPIVSKLPICAYVGFPLYNEHSEVIGTLCAIDQHIGDGVELELSKQYIKDMVSIGQTLVNQNDQLERLEKVVCKLQAQSDIDDVTGLPNHDAFFAAAVSYKQKYDALGAPIGIVIIEISGLVLTSNKDAPSYEDILRALSADIATVLRKTDSLFKLHDSRFAALLLNVDTKHVSALVRKLASVLDNYPLKKSIGADVCREGQAIADSIQRANLNRMI